MATPLDAYYVKWHFDLFRAGVAEDIAEFGLWFEGINGAEYGDPQLLSIAAGSWKAWTDHVDNGSWCNNVHLTSVTASNFLANGHTLREQRYVGGPAWVGAQTGPALPWETSLCISLYSYARGTFEPQARRKRGRYYLPPLSTNVLDSSNSGFFSDANFSGFVNQQVSFLRDAGQNQDGVPEGNLSVFSRLNGELRHVNHVYADAKIDSQRRRQNRETAGVLGINFP